MAQTMTAGTDGAFANQAHGRAFLKASPAYQAYQILHFAFVVAPVVAGLDKFFAGILVALRTRIGAYVVSA